MRPQRLFLSLILASIVLSTTLLQCGQKTSPPPAPSPAPSLSTEGKRQACLASGGKVVSAICCASAADFPNLCALGACGCAAANGHKIQTCECPEGTCFNGRECAAR